MEENGDRGPDCVMGRGGPPADPLLTGRNWHPGTMQGLVNWLSTAHLTINLQAG